MFLFKCSVPFPVYGSIQSSVLLLTTFSNIFRIFSDCYSFPVVPLMWFESDSRFLFLPGFHFLSAIQIPFLVLKHIS